MALRKTLYTCRKIVFRLFDAIFYGFYISLFDVLFKHVFKIYLTNCNDCFKSYIYIRSKVSQKQCNCIIFLVFITKCFAIILNFMFVRWRIKNGINHFLKTLSSSMIIFHSHCFISLWFIINFTSFHVLLCDNLRYFSL